MKKYCIKAICVMLCTVTCCLALFSCTNERVKEKLPEFTAKEDMSEAESFSGIYTWTAHGTKKYPENAKIPSDRDLDFKLDICRNESESFQIYLSSLVDYKELTVEVEGDVKGITASAFCESTVRTNNGVMYPDALIPLDVKKSFDLPKETVRGIFIRFTTETSAAAGKYIYNVKLKTKAGTVLHSYELTLNVYDVVLPEASTLRTAVGLSIKSLAKQYYITATVTDPLIGKHLERATELYVKYYEFLLDHKITPIELPYDILDERADKYMSDPRVTSFLVPTGVSDEKLKAYYDKLCTNPEWLSKAYAYPVDEPNSVEAIDLVIAESERIRRICPELKINGAFFTNISYDGTRDTVDIMEQYHDIICPKIANWNVNDRNYGCGIQDVIGNKGTFTSRIDKMREEGKEIWSYVCVTPRGQYFNFMVDEEGLRHRRIFWQQYELGTTGFLYWSCNWWNDIADPWTQMNTVMWADVTAFGDGSLLYNGNKVGVDGACGSIRLEAFRDGIEDYDLIVMAKELLGEKWINKRISRANSTVTTDSYLNSIRTEIIKAIEDELK